MIREDWLTHSQVAAHPARGKEKTWSTVSPSPSKTYTKAKSKSSLSPNQSSARRATDVGAKRAPFRLVELAEVKVFE